MPNPSKTKTIYLDLNEYKLNQSALNDTSKIEEWYINNTENIVAVKFNEKNISEDEIKLLLK